MLDILDTAGQEEYSSMREQYTRTGASFLIVYSITSKASFENAKNIVEFAKRVKNEDKISAVSVMYTYMQ